MPIWTDLVDPAELTGYVRESLAAIEARKGSLARFLPNRVVNDIVVRFTAGQAGLIHEAAYRAYDAENKVGKRGGAKRVTIEIPAVGLEVPISEYDQLRNRGAGNDEILEQVWVTADQVALAVSDRVERVRGAVLSTGVATISEIAAADSFGRSASHTATASTLWTAAGADPIADLQTWIDVYEATNGTTPGAIVTSRKVFRLLQSNEKLATQLNNGATRAATAEQVHQVIEGAGLPPIEIYSRRVLVGGVLTPVLNVNEVLLLPAPVDEDDFAGSQLGATFWGRTLTASDPDYQLEEAPGIVASVHRAQKPPLIAEVVADAIALPVLANADLSFKATVAA